VNGTRILCPAGTWGNNITGSTTVCPNVCSSGFLCPAGSVAQTPCGNANVYCVNNVQIPVPTGHYSTPETAQTVTTRNGTAQCPPGFYCSAGIRTACAPGLFGATAGLTSSSCSGQCPSGFFCPGTGNTNATAFPCGSAAFYCPIGSNASLAVTAGHYSVGSASQVLCEAGFFCVSGVRQPCAGGRYSSATGLSAACTLLCTAGFYCPDGSTSGTAFQCGSANSYWCVLWGRFVVGSTCPSL
jgi:hypothetical protein